MGHELDKDPEAVDRPLVTANGCSSCTPDLQSCDTQTSSSDAENGRKLEADPEFLKDLLRKANGDQTKVKDFLQELGLRGPVEKTNNNKESEMPEKLESDVDSRAAEAGAPETFFCPISFHLFRDPVLLPTGQTYERCAIERWLSQGTPSCPVTGVLMQQPVTITPNVALRRAIEDWAENNAPFLLGEDGKVVPIPANELPSESSDRADVDADYAVAVQLQEQEFQQRMLPRISGSAGRNIRTALFQQARQRSSADAKRVTRCLNLLWLITGLHVAVFFTSFGLSGWEFEKLDVNPLIGFSASGLSVVGATNHPAIVHDNEWWRIIVSVFVNAGFIHLEATLAAVWTFGRFLATKMSFLSIATLYLVSGMAGVMVSANFATHVVTAGASGAVFGLIGAVFCELLLNSQAYHLRYITLLVLMGVGVTNAVIGLTPLLDNWCAIGGLICGTLTGGAIILGRRNGDSGAIKEMITLMVQILFSVMAIAIFVVATVGLLVQFDGSKSCSWCRKVTCVSTKWWNCETAAILPDHCVFNIAGNLTTKITCPSGATANIEISQPTQEMLEKHCENICAVSSTTAFNAPALETFPVGAAAPDTGFVAANNTE